MRSRSAKSGKKKPGVVTGAKHLQSFDARPKVLNSARATKPSVGAIRQALRESEHRYRSLFSKMSEGFVLLQILFDKHGEPADYQILDINPACERLTGFRREVVIGKTVRELFKNIEPEWILVLGNVALTGEPAHCERFIKAVSKHYEVIAYSPSSGQVACLFLDVTARKRAEDALRESQDRLRLAIDSTGLGIFDFRAQPYGLFCSEFAKTHAGLSPENSLDEQDLLRSVPPEDRQAFAQAVQNAMQPGRSGQFSVEYRTNGCEGGEPRWISAWGKVFCDAQNRPVRVIGVTLDITERKRMEQALARSQRTCQSLSENIAEGFLTIDAQGQVTDANKPVLQMLGYSPEQIRLLRHEDLFSASTQQLVRKDGSACVASVRTFPLQDQTGKPAGVCMLVQTKLPETAETLFRAQVC